MRESNQIAIDLGAKLKDCAKANRYSVAELSRLTGLSKYKVNQVFQGTKRVPLYRFGQIAEAMEMTLKCDLRRSKV